jgi:hypothetical protein
VARQRPTASSPTQPSLVCLNGGRPDADLLLTRAEAAALRRSAPLTHAALSAHFTSHPPPAGSAFLKAEVPLGGRLQRHDGDVVA